MTSLFGLSHNVTLLVWALVAIVLLIVFIAKFKWNPFVVLLMTAVFLGLIVGMQPADVAKSVQTGFGNTLGTIAIVIGLGTILGKMLAESGGAEQIANTIIDKFGERRIAYSILFVAIIIGIPVFFEVGVILLIPILYTLVKKTRKPMLAIGIPLITGLSVAHGLIPPHPAPMIAIEAYHADIGKTILLSLLVGIPSAILAGPLFAKFISKRIEVEPPADLMEQFATKDVKRPPGFGITLLTILMPVILMLIGSAASIIDPEGTSGFTMFCKFIGNEIIALLIAAIFAIFSLGFARGFSKEQVNKFTMECLAPTASIILIIGGGGAFKGVLIDSGVGKAIAAIATNAHLNLIVFAFLVAALIRLATGSSSVAMTTAAGIVTPVLAVTPGANVELVVLATGAGSLIASHVNDAGFWLVKEFLNMSVPQTLKSWTVLETILSLSAFVITLALSFVL
ncbi:gluconate:H+ symporter [Cohnella candidum]|uniref:Permease DsdX n=1 Tax=Cohnella candidum TaxID=2674991 RepID=A0A3G3JT81_9BACL|nr:gluconate:H+ symporter [Cohnella candidum]AYQ71412.1 permease DsdX [Cohnella candidum]